MVENVQGNYIENAIAMLDVILSERQPNDLLHNVRRQLDRMKEDRDYEPDFGRYLVDVESDEPFVTPLLEVAEWRRRALARRS